jgi:transposase
MVDTTVDRPTEAKRIKRPNFSVEFKRQVVEATLQPGASAALIAREHAVNANLLFKWRRHYLAGDYGMPDVAAPATPEPAALNWLPVALAQPVPATPEEPACPAPRARPVYEIECGDARLRLSGDIPTATLIEIVRGLSR